MKYLLYILILGFLFIENAMIAQPLQEATYEAKLQKADELIAEGYYLDARELYQECYQESRDPSLRLAIADCEFMFRDYDRSKKSYERIFQKVRKEDYPGIVYTYGRILKFQGEYNEAYRHFKMTIENTTDDTLRQLATNEIEGMKMASKFEPRYDLYVQALDDKINTAFSDLAPVEGPDKTLYFSTFDRNSYIKIEDKGEDDKYARIATSKQDKEGNWSKPSFLNEDINYEGYNIGGPAFTSDGRTMYFTRAELSGKNVVSSEIWVSEHNGKDWGAPQPLTGVNDTLYPALYPCPGELYGDQVLFFASNRPGGYGGYDIYYAKQLGATEFGLPVNLGPAVNTILDDITPYYANGTLYYSSEGLPSMGGFDIFYTNWDGNTWSAPENMGLGYNSRYDDMYYKTNINTDQGFLVSNRPTDKVRSLRNETCCDNIFTVGIKDIEIKALTTIFHKGEPLKGATIELVEVNKDGKILDATSAKLKGNTANIRLQADKLYKIFVSKDGYNLDSTEINTLGMNKSYQFKNQVELEVAEPEVDIVTINETIRLNNIYYDYDDDKILTTAEKDLYTLLELLNEYPEMVIELSSHTDARGNDSYNEDLSQRRAESAKRWLVNKGVQEDRIVAKGYGETQILNECTNGVECTEEQHQQNRRTEFKIIAGPKSIKIKREVKRESKSNQKGKLNVDDNEF